MSTSSIHSIGSNHVIRIETLQAARMLVNVVNIETTASVPAHRNVLSLIEQAIPLMAEEDVREMVRFKNFVQYGIDRGLRFKFSIVKAARPAEGQTQVEHYLTYGNENADQLDELLKGNVMYFAGIIKFYN